MNPLEIVIPVEATGPYTVAWLMIAIPLVVAAILLLGGKATNSWGHYLGVAGAVGSFVVALVLWITMLGAQTAQRAVHVEMFDWIRVGTLDLRADLLVDQLSILFALLVTGVGSLIFVYSLGYMAHDPNRRRFFAFLNIFIAAMLTLVLADNYALLFVGWEGVGLASYLLIGFWQERRSAALAAKKAFVVNRIGDLGLLAALFTMVAQFGSVNFAEVNENAQNLSPAWATAIGFFLLLAACGKSAQVPLQSWLLDAMEGPTPVSALIHAATMVTAGVYLVVRSHTIYELTAAASLAVCIVGVVTLLAGAWIGSTKDDIKKVLAGSTMSQIGYMMLAAGIGPAGGAFAIFHLFTHGFFKANMFLGAGSIMHAMDDDTDMRHFGALRKAMPWTFLTFGMGYLAIIGIPPLSGFYSKDHIIVAAWDKGWYFGVLAMIGALITAFYMTRLMVMTFFGEKRWADGVHPHESPRLMVVPLVLLALGSIVLGVILNSAIQTWLAPPTGFHPHEASLWEVPWQGWVTLVLVLVGAWVGWVTYRSGVSFEQPRTKNPIVYIGRNDLLADKFNDVVFVRGGGQLVKGVSAVDDGLVDGGVRSASALATATGGAFARLQNGYSRSYGLLMVLGTVLVSAVLILGRLA
ncbi:NADH-quinone oxidoreductase subunit L [Brooklawnia cerclae]|uniref:NADH-quinone oxidoreductase subunit L n=1 Tax=Brooklawnia cerclae TaxID=349934 RepID=A0ABX0SBM5_9ACTN|nr:NADH-quinone oxidoreductase subunit L [Brooklawnia cerclae]